MKKRLIIITSITFILLFMLVGYFLVIRKRPVLPPTRYGVGKSYVSLENIYTFETAIASADIVAHVEIGDWLGEDDNHSYYSANVIEQFTGEKVTTFILKQDGCSQWTISRYPLFTVGNELLLFLKKSKQIDNAYFIAGSYSTVLYAVSDNNGNVYYLDRFNILSSSAEGIINSIPQDSFARELYQKLTLEDPVLSEYTSFEYVYFYSRDDFLTLIP